MALQHRLSHRRPLHAALYLRAEGRGWDLCEVIPDGFWVNRKANDGFGAVVSPC